jgi:hypothetical protein
MQHPPNPASVSNRAVPPGCACEPCKNGHCNTHSDGVRLYYQGLQQAMDAAPPDRDEIETRFRRTAKEALAANTRRSESGNDADDDPHPKGCRCQACQPQSTTSSKSTKQASADVWKQLADKFEKIVALQQARKAKNSDPVPLMQRLVRNKLQRDKESKRAEALDSIAMQKAEDDYEAAWAAHEQKQLDEYSQSLRAAGVRMRGEA